MDGKLIFCSLRFGCIVVVEVWRFLEIIVFFFILLEVGIVVEVVSVVLCFFVLLNW